MMPQLLPFFFVNSITTMFVLLAVVIWVFSVVILPLFPRLQLARLLVVRL